MSDVDNPNVNTAFPPDWQEILYLRDKIPFFKAQSVPDPTSFWGGSDFDHLAELNKDIDQIMTFINIIVEQSADTEKQVPKDSGIDPSVYYVKGPKITEPHTASHGAGVRYVDPPAVPPALPMALELFLKLWYDISQGFSIDQANTAGREVIAAKAIGMLTEQENRSYAGEQLSVEHCIIECGRMATSLMLSHYIDSRLITFSDGGEEQEAEINAELFRMPIRLTIVPGSTMPTSKAAEDEKVIGMKREGIVDNEYALQKLEVEGWRDVVVRMKEGPCGEFLKKLFAMLDVPQEIKQAITEIMRMDMKEFEKALRAGEIGKIQLPQPGQDEAAQKGQKLEQDKIAIENASMMLKNDELRAKIKQINKEIEKIDAEIRKIMADAEKTVTEKDVAVEGAKRDKESLEIERARFVKEMSEPEVPEKMGDKNTAGYRERGQSSNNKME